MSVLIKNGRVITAVDDYMADIFIEKETVTLIGKNLEVEADETIDASGKYLFPGGLDPHTHLDMPFGGTTSADDFETHFYSVKGSPGCERWSATGRRWHAKNMSHHNCRH